MSQAKRTRVTAQDFYDFDKCPHRVYLNRYGDPAEKLPESEFLNILFENGTTHEWEIVKALEYETPAGESLEERAAATLELMKRGVRLIYQGVVLQSDRVGIPDLLERVPGKSTFGKYFYRPVDIKAGSGFQNQANRNLRDDYALQLFHYAQLLKRIQGKFPPRAEILNKQNERVAYPLAHFKAKYKKAEQEIKALTSGAKTGETVLCGECGNCQWWGHCEKALVVADDVTLLADVGRSKKKVLNGAGVWTIHDLANFDFSTKKLRGIGAKAVEAMKRQATCVISNRIQIISKPAIPNPPRKIYLDFEDDPTQDLIYLCGMWIEPAIRGLNYHGLFCMDEAGEAKIWDDLQDICEALKGEDFVVFHFSPYEKTKLATLERKYGVSDEAALKNFRRRMVDLHLIVRDSVVLPARGYGLKKIAPFVGLKYSAANAGGAQSIVWFHQYQQNPKDTAVVSELLQYNREDCIAMKWVEEWLRDL